MSRRVTQERYATIRQSYWRKPKTVSLSLAANGVWALGQSYCADEMSDGFIPSTTAVLMLARGDKKLVKELVDAERWADVEGGYQVIDYLDHNPSRAEMDATREAKRQAGSRGGKTKAARVAAATPPATNLPEQTPSKTLLDRDLDRELENPTGSPPTPQGGESGTPMDPLKPQRGILLRAHRRRYSAATGHDVPPAKNSPADIAELLPWLVGYAQKTGQSFDQAAEAILERWWQDPYAASKGWPLWHLAKHVDEFAEALPPALAKTQPKRGMTPVSSPEAHERAEREQEEPDWLRGGDAA